ncbi:HRDC domain-containing protein [Marinobacter sediminum]|uniref:ribonuclease D n=1 Tax=Marinobacter sediminum TaxID=256323 RepID=UPI00202F34F8|nr:HRDC domain-containing protein [Marinobacter sediminum]MCM0611851.1 HRDC domain-containing protein [Marinobacter sediminum]
MAPSIPAVDVPPAPDTIHWIREPEALDQWLAKAPGSPLALDTEFERVNTFHPIPGLVQLGLDGEFCLVDPAVAERSKGFREVLSDTETPKLLYAMSEDLELFRQWLGIEPKGVLDLQIGAAMAGAGFSLGYARLVETLFGETLDKSATRSDWLARPLSDAQQRYAVDDIRFLEPMYRWVMGHLRERGLEHALPEESTRFADELAEQDDPGTHYLKLRGGWTLTPQQQGVLKELVKWREQECQRRDRPRNRVLADPLLIAIADKMPKSLRELSNIQGLPTGAVRRYGETLQHLVEGAVNADNSGLERIAPPLNRDQQAFLKILKRLFRKAAEHADIPVELLAPRKRLEKVVQEKSLSGQPFFHGWREQILAPVRPEIEELLTS